MIHGKPKNIFPLEYISRYAYGLDLDGLGQDLSWAEFE